MFEQKDIVLIPFPYSDLTGAKKRPALIISNSRLNNSDDRICCLITSQKTREGILIKNNFIENGFLPFKSWIKPHRVFTIDKKIILKRLCNINQNFHQNILENLNEYIN